MDRKFTEEIQISKEYENILLVLKLKSQVQILSTLLKSSPRVMLGIQFSQLHFLPADFFFILSSSIPITGDGLEGWSKFSVFLTGL